MAGFTHHVYVFAFEFENREGMIEFCRQPAVFVMTVHTTKSITTFMRFIVVMTGIAILQCHLKIAQPTRIYMTLHTLKSIMPAYDLERKLIVIEVGHQTIHTIMTIETSRAKGYCVRGHESQIHFAMTGVASLQIEFGYIFGMAIGTNKRLTRDVELVTV